MENTQINQIIDIRQSPQWGKYLEYLGWQKHQLNGGRFVYSRKAGPLTVAKFQRPTSLNAGQLKELDELAHKNIFAFVKLEPSPEQNVDELTQAQYKASASPLCPPSTIFINLANDIQTLTNKLSHSAKYSINRAKREGGVVEIISKPSVSLLKQVYPILKATAVKQKFMVPSFDDIKTKADIWRDECHLAIVKNSAGDIQGVKMFLSFNGNVWFMHGGTLESARKTKFGYLLLWESILYLKAKGYRYLDLEGKDDKRFPAFTKNWGGFSHFKEKFGGQNVEYPAPMIKYYSAILKHLSRIYGSASML